MILRILGTLLITVSITSCGSIGKMISQAIEKNKKLEVELKDHKYSMEKEELKGKLVSYFSGWRSLPPTQKQDEALQEKINDGFSYGGKFYKKAEPNIMGMIQAWSAGDQDILKEMMVSESYFVLEDTPTTFKILHQAHVYEAQELMPGQTQLQVHHLSKYKRGPLKLETSVVAFLTKTGSLFTIKDGPVLLDYSMKSKRRTTMEEWQVLQKIDKATADEIDKRISL